MTCTDATCQDIHCPLCACVSRLQTYKDDIAWWQDRIKAWGRGRPVHATQGWTSADDHAGLENRQRHYAEELARLAVLTAQMGQQQMKEAA